MKKTGGGSDDRREYDMMHERDFTDKISFQKMKQVW